MHNLCNVDPQKSLHADTHLCPKHGERMFDEKLFDVHNIPRERKQLIEANLMLSFVDDIEDDIHTLPDVASSTELYPRDRFVEEELALPDELLSQPVHELPKEFNLPVLEYLQMTLNLCVLEAPAVVLERAQHRFYLPEDVALESPRNNVLVEEPPNGHAAALHQLFLLFHHQLPHVLYSPQCNSLVEVWDVLFYTLKELCIQFLLDV